MTVDSGPASPDCVLSMTGIEKRYGPITVLKGVDLALRRGETLALVGENGAGKSTLMRILAGATRPDAGEIAFEGEKIASMTPTTMIGLGIAVIYQELMQARHLTVAENVFLGRPVRGPLGVVDWTKMRRLTREVMQRLGFDIDPKARVDALSVAQRQIVEIARALTQDARVIILDEPSAVLGDAELVKLFAVMRRLKAQGVSFIYISHRLNEVMAECDRVAVLRDGGMIWTRRVADVSVDDIVRAMVGRELDGVFPHRTSKPGPVALEVKHLDRAGVLKDISFSVRSGEIVGVCGLAGAGRSELLRAVFGADPVDRAEISLHGKPVKLTSPLRSLRARVGLVPEDRKTDGLFLTQTIAFNVSIARLKRIAAGFMLNLRREHALADDLSKALRVRTPNVRQTVGALSGGNQQKCMIARSSFAECDVMLVDEPTRGVDIGAKVEIYQIMAEMADQRGAAILMVSSELPEILGLCDRMLVMREGEISAELTRAEASQELIMKHATFHS